MNHRKARSLKMMRGTSNIPLVKQMYDLVRADPRTNGELAQDVGINASTLCGWTRREPRLLTFEAVLNCMGYRLKIVPIEKEPAE